MFDWVYSNRGVFLSNYVEIGRNQLAATKLQEEQHQFTTAANVNYLFLTNIISISLERLECLHQYNANSNCCKQVD